VEARGAQDETSQAIGVPAAECHAHIAAHRKPSQDDRLMDTQYIQKCGAIIG
jgi:hypothetical protein